MTASVVVAAIVIVAVAAFGQTVAGFGFGLLTVPPLGLFTGAKTAVVVAAVLVTVNSGLLVWSERGHIDKAAARILLLGSLPGLPLGLLLLDIMSARVLRIALAAAVVVAVLSLLRPSTVRDNSRLTDLAAGFATGLLTTSLITNGPPTIWALQSRGLAPQAFRPTTSAVLGSTAVVGVVLFGAAGRLTGEVLGLAAVSTPAMFAGWFTGLRVRGRVPPELFRRLIIGLLLLGGVVTFVAAFS